MTSVTGPNQTGSANAPAKKIKSRIKSDGLLVSLIMPITKTTTTTQRARRTPSQRYSYEEMLELEPAGAKVVNIRAVEFARRHGVTLHVRSSFTEESGTWVSSSEKGINVEEPVIAFVLVSEAMLFVTVPNREARFESNTLIAALLIVLGMLLGIASGLLVVGGVINGYTAIGAEKATVANRSTFADRPGEMIRHDPSGDKMPYQTDIVMS